MGIKSTVLMPKNLIKLFHGSENFLYNIILCKPCSMELNSVGHAKNQPPLQCSGWGGSENENECVATSIRREVGISFGFTTTSWMDLVMENFFDFPLVTIIHSSRHNTIALMACLWMLIAFYRCTLFCPPTTLIYFGKKRGIKTT